jgi:hypothetical protein
MAVYASYVCFMRSCFIENHPIDLEVTNPLFLRWFSHTGTMPKEDKMLLNCLELVSRTKVCCLFYRLFYETKFSFCSASCLV